MKQKATITERVRVINGATYKDWRISLGSVNVDGENNKIQCFVTGTYDKAKAEGAKLELLGGIAALLTWDQIKDLIQSFKVLSHDDVKAECAKMYLMRKRQGAGSMLLTRDQVTDYVTAKAILSDAGCPMSLTKAAQDYVRMMSGAGMPGGEIDDMITLGALAEMYQASLGEKLSAPYRSSVACHIRALGKRISPDTPCGKITTDAMKAALEDIAPKSAKSFKNIRGAISTMFSWGIREKKVITRNPVSGVAEKAIDHEEPTSLKSDAVREILAEGLTAHNAQMYMPWLILGFFCGIRSAEIERMTWDNILWEEGEIRIKTPKGYTSGTHPRHVTLNPAALAWLSPYRRESGPIGASQAMFSRWRKGLKSYRLITEATGDNAGNIMRHTFCTMHYAMHKNINLTAAEMGHYDNVQTTLNHYKGLNTRKDAEAFWALRPEGVSSAASVTGAPGTGSRDGAGSGTGGQASHDSVA